MTSPNTFQTTSSAASRPAATEAFNLANGHYRAERWAEALAAYELALAEAPELEAAALQRARCLVQLGELAQAREAFAQLLKAFAGNYSGWLEAGHVCRQQGVAAQALACYRRAVALVPGRFEAQLSLARLLEEQGQWDPAAAHYHHALSGAKPEVVRTVHWRMARFRLERGDAPRALESMRQALLVLRLEQAGAVDENERAEMQIDLGEVFMRLGMREDGHRAFERASAATAEPTLVRLAERSFRFNLWQEAKAVLQRNVALHPNSAQAHWNLAHSLAESWQLQDALQALAQAEALAPQPGADSMRASIAGRSGDVDTALRLYQAMAEAQGPLSPMRCSAAMSALYSDRLSAAEVAALHRSLFAAWGQNARPASSFSNPKTVGRRLRLGLVSADFHHQHPVNLFFQPLLARLDHDAFELSVYFTGSSHDEQTQLAKSRAAHWVEAAHLSDGQLARRIEADGIDILLDLAGHTSMNRMRLFAQRAAPVQASFLGYPGSTGVPHIDWMLVDPVVAPPGSEGLFSERLARLPHCVFCFAPEADYPYPAYGPAHAERPLTFGSFNNLPKLTPRTVRLWAAVLQAVPGSRLLLKAPSFQDPGAVAAFVQRFGAEGIGPERLEFRGPVGLGEMMAEYADVDIALDPVPYNGGTTSLQALWMGVPVVVQAGGHFVSRMGASFMGAAGLDAWVAQSDADYVRIATQMAQDRPALLALKQGLRQRLLARPAWQVDAYTRDLEAALQAMWRAHCEGAPEAH